MKTQVESETNLTVGGYNIYPTNKIPKSLLSVFEIATKLIGEKYKSLILVRKQLVHSS